jgi:hypothetical protein
MRPDKRALADRARADRSIDLAAVAAGGKGIWHPVPVGSYEQLSISLSIDEGRHGARKVQGQAYRPSAAQVANRRIWGR